MQTFPSISTTTSGPHRLPNAACHKHRVPDVSAGNHGLALGFLGTLVHANAHCWQVEWHVQDVEDTPKPMGPDALLKSIGKKQRHRTGYDAAVSLMHRASPAAAFILCDDPMPTLASHTALILDGTDSVPPASDAVRFP